MKCRMGTMQPFVAGERSIKSGRVAPGRGRGKGGFPGKMPTIRVFSCNGKKILAEREVSPMTC